MDKNKEIKLLKQLNSDKTYFSEFLGKYVPCMITNIKNDFPIEHNLNGNDKVLIELSKNQYETLTTFGIVCMEAYIDRINNDVNFDENDNKHSSLKEWIVKTKDLIEKLRSI